MLRRYFVYTCLALFLVACGTQSANQRPNFTGDWILDRVNTKIEVVDLSSLDSDRFVIEHHEPTFKVQRTFTMVDGRRQSVSYELTTDGKEVTLSSLGLGTYARLYWERDALVLVIRIGGAEGETTDTAHFRLTTGASRLEVDEIVRGPSRNYDDHWVFTKK